MTAGTQAQQRPRITTVLPCTDLASATHFFVRLGFKPPTEEEKNQYGDYLLLTHSNGTDLHLRQTGPDEKGWLDPLKNPFGIYMYTEDVAALAVEFRDEIIGPFKEPQVADYGMLEFALNGPDGCLVRVGWPADEKNVA
jgi:hypothetical protein